jgi:hypothetical protein
MAAACHKTYWGALMQGTSLDMSAAQAWFALQAMPRNEKNIDYLLRQKGYERFTPIYRQKRK